MAVFAILYLLQVVEQLIFFARSHRGNYTKCKFCIIEGSENSL